MFCYPGFIGLAKLVFTCLKLHTVAGVESQGKYQKSNLGRRRFLHFYFKYASDNIKEFNNHNLLLSTWEPDTAS
jgi:hypothetical protein